LIGDSSVNTTALTPSPGLRPTSPRVGEVVEMKRAQRVSSTVQKRKLIALAPFGERDEVRGSGQW
jgi:hypothetical protein